MQFEVAGQLKSADACHCSQCRKQSGHYWASASVARDELAISGDDNLRWYSATPGVRRGSCATCGSFLFWDAESERHIAVALGAIDGRTGVTLEKHIYVADKGDYYEISDGLPQEQQ